MRTVPMLLLVITVFVSGCATVSFADPGTGSDGNSDLFVEDGGLEQSEPANWRNSTVPDQKHFSSDERMVCTAVWETNNIPNNEDFSRMEIAVH